MKNFVRHLATSVTVGMICIPLIVGMWDSKPATTTVAVSAAGTR
ncbi:hypothetical protein ACF09L_28600 [Streptomyces sp. NPDC014779]